ncbi:hypothetical protein QBC46DRAFT_434051 [Diplogelasinospora grovesii]|uniref:Uncharacterized protein n=1 Tax=Diplogelasinospora grovesii TaxID=303347 RepID=A0AAN6N7T9_9PEZI|nr:hypothetical protein QBC46DRAFT_434051 [Diplogelasinospora grovesii]
MLACSESRTINGNKMELSGPDGDVSGTKYLLVSLKDDSVDSRKAVEGAGANIVSLVGESVYLCRYEGADVTPLRKISAVQRIDRYPIPAKIHWDLLDDIQFLLGTSDKPKSGAGEAAAAATPVKPQQPLLIPVKVYLHDDEPSDGAEALAKHLIGANIIKQEDTEVYSGLLNTTIDVKNLSQVTVLDSVEVIKPRPERRAFNNGCRGILAAENVYLAENGTIFDGAGEIIAVGDTGFDNGEEWTSLAAAHPAFHW